MDGGLDTVVGPEDSETYEVDMRGPRRIREGRADLPGVLRYSSVVSDVFCEEESLGSAWSHDIVAEKVVIKRDFVTLCLLEVSTVVGNPAP
jgi:hypothetical protein